MNSVDAVALVKEKVINMKFENDMDFAKKETSKRAEDLLKNADTLDNLEALKDKMQQLEFDIIVEGTKREKLFDNLYKCDLLSMMTCLFHEKYPCNSLSAILFHFFSS